MKNCNSIELHDIRKSFKTRYNISDVKKNHLKRTAVREFQALKGINLEIKKGEVLGIIGRNGSGKSTLLSIIAGIMSADSGTIEKSGTVASILELGMGFHPDMTGRENIYIKGALYGFSKKQIDEKIESIISYSELGEFIDQPVRTYSSGMNGRLAFSIMINVKANILLVDEILSTGDSIFSSKASGHFKNIIKTGHTVVIVSHSISQMRDMCSRVAWIESGMLREIGDPKMVCGHYEREMNESQEVIEVLSDSGNQTAQNTLGCRYRDGQYFKKDFKKAEELFRLSAMAGNDKAMVNLADLLYAEKRDLNEAFELYRKASDNGNTEARVKLSIMFNTEEDSLKHNLIEHYRKLAATGCAKHMYEYADIILKNSWSNEDRTKAFGLFIKAAEKNYVPAIYQLATMFRDGIGTVKDMEKSLQLFEKAANEDDVRAQIFLGDLYYNGIFVTKNDIIAFKWYHMAAENGNANARYHVAIMYYEGIGTEKNNEEAQHWFKLISNQNFTKYYAEMGWELLGRNESSIECLQMASHLGNQISTTRFAEIYRDGRGVEADPKKALELFSEVAKHGNVTAMGNIIAMVSGGAVDNHGAAERALSMMKQMAINGNAEASRKLGDMYHNGIWVSQNMQEAIKWYSSSANNGNMWCKFKLGEIYRDGKGVEADPKKALELFSEVAEHGNVTAMGNIIAMVSGGAVNNHGAAERALSMMKQMAINGNAEASRKLGILYFDDSLNLKNEREGIKWFDFAVREGDAWSKNKMGEIYRDGKSVSIDTNRAFALFKESAEAGNVTALANIADIITKGLIDDSATLDKAMSKLRQLAASGNNEAQYRLRLYNEKSP